MNLAKIFVAGDSVFFIESFADYLPRDGWSLRYVFINAAGKITLDSVAEGDDHRFSESTTTTSSWVAGDYTVGLYALRSGERETLGQSVITIQPDPLTVATYDGRSSAKKTLDALRAAYDEMIDSGGLVQMVSMNGRTTQFSNAADILAQINFFQRQVNSETQAKNLQNGCGLGGRILTRF